MATFAQLNLKPNVLTAIEKIGFIQMTEIQAKAIPLDLKNHNIIGHSQTGTGKTHAFLIPLFNKLSPGKNVQSIIISPTRELARQVFEEAIKFNEASDSKLNIKLVIGGTDKGTAVGKYQKEIPDVIIGTPGRVRDIFVASHYFTLRDVKTLIVDEADMVFDLGFLEELRNISKKLSTQAQYLLYSATIPKGLKVYISKFVKNVKELDIDTSATTSRNISHYLINTKHKERLPLLSKIIQSHNPYLAIVFVNKKKDVESTVALLKLQTKSVIGLHGGMDPRNRKNVLNDVKNLKYNLVVATDIAARGIDIVGVSHVYSLAIPFEHEYYIHRSGRTGRASLKGESFLFYDSTDKDAIAKLTSKNISFTDMIWKEDELQERKIRVYRGRNMKKTDEEVEILGIIAVTKSKMKKKGVKPGYRKKMKAQIDDVRRKKVRKAIKTNINLLKKARARAKQIKLSQIKK